MDLISAAAPGISQISEVMDVGYTCNLLVFSLLLLLDLSVGFMGYWGGARILSHALTKAFNKNPQLEIGIEKYKSVAVNKYRILPLDFIFSFTGLWRNAGDHSVHQAKEDAVLPKSTSQQLITARAHFLQQSTKQQLDARTAGRCQFSSRTGPRAPY